MTRQNITRPNLREIAQAAGISVATASFALNNKPGVSEAVRNRVVAIAERMGYKRDARLAELMAHVANSRERDTHTTLAFITRDEHARMWEKHPELLPLWEGAARRAKELGYRLEEFRLNEPGMTPARLRSILISRNIRGLLFAPPRAQSARTRLDFDFTGFAAVMSDLCQDSPAINYVASDHFCNVLTCLGRAYELGYCRPLLALNGDTRARSAQLMQGAYFSFIHQHPEFAPIPFFVSDNDALAPLLTHANKHRADVVLCNISPQGAVKPNELGWITLNRTPEETRLAGLDRQMHREAGFLVDMVVADLHRNETGLPKNVRGMLTPGVFLDGPSLPRKATISRPAKPKSCICF